jgi:MFS family permease
VRDALALLRSEPRARLFFGALTQSSLGAGAAYVALLILAYARFHSPWAISLVLLADLLPAMLFGPVFGAAADRWSRRWCAVVADIARAGAFIAIALVPNFEATFALALLAGAGNGLFKPATLAGLPSLVSPRNLSPATSVYGAITDLGFTAGPAIAAVLLLVASPELVMAVNGVTFAISAVILAGLKFGAAPQQDATHDMREVTPSLLRSARQGLRTVASLPVVRTVVAGSSAAFLFGGLLNVAELPFATDDLGTTGAGYSILVALFGMGFIAGSLGGTRGGSEYVLKRGFLSGVLLMGLGSIASGLAPTFPVALGTFIFPGLGNGVLLVHERVLVQKSVPDTVLARVFGVKDAMAAWAFAIAFIAAGSLISILGPRGLITAAGIGEVLVFASCAFALRRERLGAKQGSISLPEGIPARQVRALGGRSDALRYGHAREQGPHAVSAGDFWLTLLDDLRQRRDDPSVELGSRARD